MKITKEDFWKALREPAHRDCNNCKHHGIFYPAWDAGKTTTPRRCDTGNENNTCKYSIYAPRERTHNHWKYDG